MVRFTESAGKGTRGRCSRATWENCGEPEQRLSARVLLGHFKNGFVRLRAVAPEFGDLRASVVRHTDTHLSVLKGHDFSRAENGIKRAGL